MNIRTNYMKKDRDPGWIELFFDLAYAVLLGRMAHLLYHTHHGHMVMEDIIHFLWIFMIQFMVWMLYTVYMNIYGNNSLRQNLFGFALMFSLFAIAILMHDIGTYAPYIAATMGGMSFLVAGLYWVSKDVVPENRSYAIYKFRASVSLGVVSMSMLFFTSVTAMVVTMIAYPAEHLGDEIFLKRVGMAKPDGEHFVERIGIFIILLTGESFITLVDNIPDEISGDTLLPVGLLLLIIFGMFINYFSHNERMAHADYERYSQLLFPNYLVMIAYTILPVIVYHGIFQGLDHMSFRILTMLFVVMFYFGNGQSYRMVPDTYGWQNFIYTMIFPIAFALVLWLTVDYTGTMVALTVIVLMTAILVIIVNNWQRSPVNQNR